MKCRISITMSRERLLALWLLYRRRRCRKGRERCWMRPINMQRDDAFYTLFENLRESQEKFFGYFRMSIASFDELHVRLKDSLQRQNTVMRDCVQPIQMLAVTLRYLAKGCTFTELHHEYRLGTSTVSKIVREVCCYIWIVMSPECMPKPTVESWRVIAENFEKRANFPHCLGAVDGKFVRINPHGSKHRIHNTSVVLMAVADSEYRFVYADVGSYRDDCDTKIFRNSSMWKSIENNEIQLPPEKHLPGTEDANMPYFFVGDEAFALHKHLLRPYGRSSPVVAKRVFNYRLSRARRCVECTFGILTNKWKIFQKPVYLQPDFAVDIVKACVILHNFIRNRDGFEIEDTTTIVGLQDVPREDNICGNAAANSTRTKVAEYFVTDAGSVSWQLSKI